MMRSSNVLLLLRAATRMRFVNAPISPVVNALASISPLQTSPKSAIILKPLTAAPSRFFTSSPIHFNVADTSEKKDEVPVAKLEQHLNEKIPNIMALLRLSFCYENACPNVIESLDKLVYELPSYNHCPEKYPYPYFIRDNLHQLTRNGRHCRILTALLERGNHPDIEHLIKYYFDLLAVWTNKKKEPEQLDLYRYFDMEQRLVEAFKQSNVLAFEHLCEDLKAHWDPKTLFLDHFFHFLDLYTTSSLSKPQSIIYDKCINELGYQKKVQHSDDNRHDNRMCLP